MTVAGPASTPPVSLATKDWVPPTGTDAVTGRTSSAREEPFGPETPCPRESTYPVQAKTGKRTTITRIRVSFGIGRDEVPRRCVAFQRQPSAGSTVSSRRMFLATFAHTRQNTTTTRTSARNTDSVSRRVLRLLGV